METTDTLINHVSYTAFLVSNDSQMDGVEHRRSHRSHRRLDSRRRFRSKRDGVRLERMLGYAILEPIPAAQN